jgi:quercetin dioxygenase-like cupin family protein
MAMLDGDPNKGAAHFMVKFAPGTTVPAHHHTPDHYVVVLSGTMMLTSEGKEQKLPAGSYFWMTGKGVHTTSCAAGAECVLMIDTRGKWDVVPEKAAAPKT